MMKYLQTHFFLPPRAPPGALVREFLERAFGTYRWFRPKRYGRAVLDGTLNPDELDLSGPIAVYERFGSLTVTASTNQDYLLIYPAKRDDPPHIGEIIWGTSAKKAAKPSWRDAHLQQTQELIGLTGAILTQSSLGHDFDSKQRMLVPDPDGLAATETFTVRDYSEGLAGLFWRNFFGPPFSRMFGERLSSLPAPSKQDLGGGIVLVQPYELPTQAGTPEGLECERQLIAQLGPECFYDHERHLKPSRRPAL